MTHNKLQVWTSPNKQRVKRFHRTDELLDPIAITAMLVHEYYFGDVINDEWPWDHETPFRSDQRSEHCN